MIAFKGFSRKDAMVAKKNKQNTLCLGDLCAKPILPTMVKGDKRIDPDSLFGIWANKPRSLENIRKEAWQRNQSI